MKILKQIVKIVNKTYYVRLKAEMAPIENMYGHLDFLHSSQNQNLILK